LTRDPDALARVCELCGDVEPVITASGVAHKKRLRVVRNFTETVRCDMGSRSGVLTGMSILVVEDNHDARDILRLVLQHHGALVTATSTTREALSVVAAFAPDVVICDMVLGGSDARRVLNGVRTSGVQAPIIAVSGQDFDAVALKREGFAAYLRKPIDINALVDTVLSVMRDR
jgi:CheY-like chemotaxis protein